MAMTKVDVIMEEYKALRAEILLCIERRVTINSYGLAAIGVLIGAAITAINFNHPWLAIFVFLLVLPFAARHVLDIWLSETHRLRRASHYICYLEKKIAAESSLPEPLEWEKRIREKDGPWSHRPAHYRQTVLFFSIIAVSSIFVGLLLFFRNPITRPWIEKRLVFPNSWLFFMILVILILFSITSIMVAKRINKARKLINDYNKVPSFPLS